VSRSSLLLWWLPGFRSSVGWEALLATRVPDLIWAGPVVEMDPVYFLFYTPLFVFHRHIFKSEKKNFLIVVFYLTIYPLNSCLVSSMICDSLLFQPRLPTWTSEVRL
jgi:hypothetical protein